MDRLSEAAASPYTRGYDQLWTLPFQWQSVEVVHASLHACLQAEHQELRDAINMAASELAENLVKYGSAAMGRAAGTLSLHREPGAVSLCTENGASRDDADLVTSTITTAQGAGAEAAYLRRLEELACVSRTPYSRLGLLRILFEGGFDLSCRYEEPLLTIIAHRSLTQ